MRLLLAWVCLFGAWSLATWALEGRIQTLLRPEAVIDRLVYVAVANLLIGVVGAALLVRTARGRAARFGAAGPRRSAASVAIGLLLGLGFLVVVRPPSSQLWILANAFAQVLTVSVAEVAVCFWALAAVLQAFRPEARVPVAVLTVAIGAAAFGLYHFAHSPPFDTWPMVGTLTAVGVVTGLFFVLSRDVYGTVILHNFAGTLGVTRALAQSGQLAATAGPNPVLLLMAVLSVALLLLADLAIVGRAGR